MEKPNIPDNEKQRLDELYQYQILDSLPEDEYNDIVKLVSYITQSPIAYISFVDKDRQWFKAKIGIEEEQTSRDVAFCGHAILQEGPLEIEDTLKDKRFHDNPLVTDKPNLRYYMGMPLYTPRGFPVGTLCVADYTPRQLSQEQREALTILSRQVIKSLELRRSNLNLSKDLKNKNQFLATFTHDIRNQIHIIEGVMSACELKEDKIDPEMQQNIEIINDSTDFIAKLVNNLMDLSKIEGKSLTLEKNIFSLDEMLQSLVKSFNIKSSQVNTEIFYQKDNKIPEYLIQDSFRLQQVLVNLLSNAIKFTENGNIFLEVKIQGDNQNNITYETEDKKSLWLTFNVTDSGPGIPQKQQKSIFDAYFQVKDEQGKWRKGSGLGLMICKNLVELMGGAITMTSPVVQREGYHYGTRFSFNLPFQKPKYRFSRVPQDQTQPTPSNKQDWRILIVDDNPLNLKVMSKMLEPWAYEIRQASDGQEALHLLQHNSFDYAFLDLDMPGFSGVEVLQKLQKQGNSLNNIIILSGHNKEAIQNKLEPFPISKILNKPVRRAELASLLGQKPTY